MSKTLNVTDFNQTMASTMTNLNASIGVKNFTFGSVDYIVFVFLLLASTSVGIYFGFFAKSKNTTSEYLMGGKKMKTIPIAISIVASQLSGVVIMSVPAETYAFGFHYIFNVLSIFIVIPILNFIIIPVFYENKFNNCYEYLQKRFNKRSRQLVTATFIINSFLTLPVIMFVPSMAFSQVTGINVHLINIIVSSICIFYTMLGGIKAVVWTDVLQAGIMFFSVVLVGVLGTIKAGGLEKVLDNASEGGRLDLNYSWDPRVRITIWNSFLNGIIMWTGHIGLSQSCVQRIVSLPSLEHAKKSLWIGGVGFLLIKSINAFIGIVMYAYYHHCDPILAGHVEKPDKMITFFTQDIIGHLKGMPGIFVSCVFSAALSTLSAVLNSLGGIVYFDYIKPFIQHTEARANNIMKIFVVVMGVYCVLGGFVVQQFNSILQMIITFSGINTGAIFSMFLLGMFVPKVNGKVTVVSFSLSILSMIWIIVNSRMRFQQGLIKYESLPTQIDGCEAMNIQILIKSFSNTTTSTTTSTFIPVTTALSSQRDFSIYEISFYWYKLLGAMLVWAIALPLSYVWKSDNEASKQDPKLYSSCVRKFLKSGIKELEEVVPLKVPPNNLTINGTMDHSEKCDTN